MTEPMEHSLTENSADSAAVHNVRIGGCVTYGYRLCATRRRGDRD